MANLIEETENVLILIVVLAILGAIAWLIWQFRDYFGLGKGTDESGGKKQSLLNALNGFPDGADPGSIPVAQDVQGFVESVRNFGNLIFGSNDDEEYNADQTAGINQAVANYQMPTQSQIAQGLQNAGNSLSVGNFTYDPGSALAAAGVF